MQKYYNIMLTVLFCGFLGIVLLLHLTTPDRDFSQIENRYLQGPPALSGDRVASGTFMKEFESYTTDQFPLRDIWVAAKANFERLSGKRENNGVYLAEGESLINRVDTPDTQTIAEAAEYLNALDQNTDIPVYFGLIPTAADIWRDRLPHGAPTADEQALIQQLYAEITPNTIDLRSALHTHSGEDIYYRTDHHWTSLGAYYGYTALAGPLGFDPVPLADYDKTTVSDDFYGTIYSSSGVRWVPPDVIDTYVPETGLTVTSYFTGLPEPGQLYAPEYLTQKDQYSYFLGGIQPLCVIQNPQTDGPKLLILRDSYSDSMAPFLTAHCSKIHLLDLRYYNASLKSYIAEHQFDAVLVLYSTQNFFTDQNLFKLSF